MVSVDRPIPRANVSTPLTARVAIQFGATDYRNRCTLLQMQSKIGAIMVNSDGLFLPGEVVFGVLCGQHESVRASRDGRELKSPGLAFPSIPVEERISSRLLHNHRRADLLISGNAGYNTTQFESRNALQGQQNLHALAACQLDKRGRGNIFSVRIVDKTWIRLSPVFRLRSKDATRCWARFDREIVSARGQTAQPEISVLVRAHVAIHRSQLPPALYKDDRQRLNGSAFKRLTIVTRHLAGDNGLRHELEFHLPGLRTNFRGSHGNVIP